MHYTRIIIGTIVLCLTSTTTLAHSGRTNSEGCHTKKKTGEYHCHNKPAKQAKATARTSAPVGKQIITCFSNTYNCSDFNTHYAAQKAYEYCLDITGTDVHDLDRDNDAVACEALQ